MSVRTIVEFNHDYGHVIDRDPDGFMRSLRTVLAGNGRGEWDNLRLHYGVRYLVKRHHSTDGDVRLLNEGGKPMVVIKLP